MDTRANSVIAPRAKPRIELVTASVGRRFLSAATIAVVILLLAHASRSRGDDGVWLEISAGPRGAGAGAMATQLRVGPFLDLAVCYAIGSLSIEELNRQHEDKDFMGRCGGDLLTLGQMADRAMALLPKDGASE